MLYLVENIQCNTFRYNILYIYVTKLYYVYVYYYLFDFNMTFIIRTTFEARCYIVSTYSFYI